MTCKNLILSPRLKKVYDLLPENCVVADIGTDHGYLPTYAILHGKAKNAILADINEGPLAKAQETITNYNVSEKTTLKLCDGLSSLNKDDADTIVIAGMGGETIAGIIENCDWAKCPSKRYILQPMSKIPTLREFLFKNGFLIEREELVEETEKVYIVMSVIYDGRKREYTQSDLYLGKAFYQERNLVSDYIIKVRKDISNRLKGNLEDSLRTEFEGIIDSIDKFTEGNDYNENQ